MSDTTTVDSTVLHPDHLALLEGLKARVARVFGRREPQATFWDLVTGLVMEVRRTTTQAVRSSSPRGHGPLPLRFLGHLSHITRQESVDITGRITVDTQCHSAAVRLPPVGPEPTASVPPGGAVGSLSPPVVITS
jgi:hypothetical protein